MEIVFARLSILLALGFGIGGGLYSLYCHFESNSWDDLVRSSYENMNDGYTDCEARPDSLACELIPSRQEMFDSAVEGRSAYSFKSSISLKVACIGPLVVVFLFYSLRWALTGRVRPLNVLSSK